MRTCEITGMDEGQGWLEFQENGKAVRSFLCEPELGQHVEIQKEWLAGCSLERLQELIDNVVS